jgi:acetyl-CoA synthetase
MQIQPTEFYAFGLPPEESKQLADRINHILNTCSKENAWAKISTKILTPSHPFQLHRYLFTKLYPDWQTHPELAPVWTPTLTSIANTHLGKFMQELNLQTREEFHRWSTLQFELFWQLMINKLNIIFQRPPEKICDLSRGVENPSWLLNAKLNIYESCFNCLPEKIAILYQHEKDSQITQISYGELQQLSNQIANSLIALEFQPGDVIALVLPMTPVAIATYLAVIKIGAVVASVADSFSSEEIAIRLNVVNAKAVFTQHSLSRNGKTLPLYEKLIKANAPLTILLDNNSLSLPIRSQDLTWEQFLIKDDSNQTYYADPMAYCNILFSSGTTGIPKAIPWNHTTAIKSASDAYLHQDIHEQDIVAWPTSLGWMMGPWLVFATLINQATIAIYDGLPSDRAFGKFIQETQVNILGVVPTLIARWRETACMEGLNWQTIKTFTSTGECSNPEDMLYLTHLAGYKPIIEYCGGTETGGSYITSTLVEKNYLSLFTTPTMGIDFILLDDQGHLTTCGEVALIPPSMGLSTELINADHQRIYYADMPKSPTGQILRRHGDQLRQYTNGLYSILGRVDDTMNLAGIKISSAEIERVLVNLEFIKETAAIEISLAQGPSVLVIYATTEKNDLDSASIKIQMQQRINQYLNPLFKIHDIVLVKELPKTMSNKIMRRTLREQYAYHASVSWHPGFKS